MAEEREVKETVVAARLGSRERAKVEQVAAILEEITGERNMSVALRYIVANFDIEASPLGKEFALAD